MRARCARRLRDYIASMADIIHHRKPNTNTTLCGAKCWTGTRHRLARLGELLTCPDCIRGIQQMCAELEAADRPAAASHLLAVLAPEHRRPLPEASPAQPESSVAGAPAEDRPREPPIEAMDRKSTPQEEMESTRRERETTPRQLEPKAHRRQAWVRIVTINHEQLCAGAALTCSRPVVICG